MVYANLESITVRSPEIAQSVARLLATGKTKPDDTPISAASRPGYENIFKER
jgi:hypothetical protein